MPLSLITKATKGCRPTDECRTNETVNSRCPGGLAGMWSVLGVVQLTPFAVLVAFVSRVLPNAEKAHWNWPLSVGRLSITNESYKKIQKIQKIQKLRIVIEKCDEISFTVRAVVLCSWFGVTDVMVVQRPLLYEIQYKGSFAASWQSLLRLHLLFYLKKKAISHQL